MTVDFSTKHDILIRHKDGNLTPMDEPYYEINQIDDSTWQIMSSGDYHYLLLGEDEGIAIDTGYGAGNLREYLETLSEKPVSRVINTHHHFDHSANNCYFEIAYMGKDAICKASVPYESFEGMDFFKDSYEKRVVKTGDVISLNGRNLEIFEIGDHTSDGIAILDKTHRMLFCGDEFMPGMKRFNGSVSEWREKLEPLIERRADFDFLCGGPRIIPAETFDDFVVGCDRIMANEPSEMLPEQNGHPKMEQEYIDGHKVYDCQAPHIEDIPKGGFAGPSTQKRYCYKDIVFTYEKV